MGTPLYLRPQGNMCYKELPNRGVPVLIHVHGHIILGGIHRLERVLLGLQHCTSRAIRQRDKLVQCIPSIIKLDAQASVHPKILDSQLVHLGWQALAPKDLPNSLLALPKTTLDPSTAPWRICKHWRCLVIMILKMELGRLRSQPRFASESRGLRLNAQVDLHLPSLSPVYNKHDRKRISRSKQPTMDKKTGLPCLSMPAACKQAAAVTRQSPYSIRLRSEHRHRPMTRQQ